MPDGLSTEKFIDVLQDLHTKMDTGFKGVYKKIDDVSSAFNRKTAQCESRFVNMEKDNAIRNGITCNEKKREKEKTDFWKYIIRAGIIMMMGWSAIAIWKIFIANIDKIAK
jgi:hypothetical protein